MESAIQVGKKGTTMRETESSMNSPGELSLGDVFKIPEVAVASRLRNC